MINENKMFFRIYQDKKNVDELYFVVDKKELDLQLNDWSACYEHDENGFPIIEPVMMTQKEFDDLPEFQGY